MNDADPVSEPLQRGLRAAFADPASAPSSVVLRLLQGRTADERSPAADATPRADAMGRYQVLGEIGRGGMGIVYKGRDVDLGREVAMKVLLKEHASNPATLTRFVEEAQISGQLQHPGIVPVYEMGLHQGEQPYFAMKLIRGATLNATLRQRADPAARRTELLRVFEQVCQAMAYAHARGVVHRDLKPGNVMIGAFGEVQVVDWGFAKVLAQGAVASEPRAAATDPKAVEVATIRTRSDSTHSVAGSIFGTPAYMPPEQARGEVDQLDCRSDVFGLGSILCEILTGSPPHRAEEGDVIGRAARSELGPARERLRQSGADAALVALCEQCLAAAPAHRPASAQQVAERIHDYLSSVEERARQAQVHAAAARVRARATLALAAIALLVLGLLGGAWIWLEHAANSRRARATQQVADALHVANESAGKARAGGAADLAPWDRTVDAAEQAVVLARHEDVDADARAGATNLLATVTGERDVARRQHAQHLKDRATHTQLVELRIPGDDDVRAIGWREREARRLDAAYADVLTRHLDAARAWSELPDAEIQDALARSSIGIELATALDHWAMIRDQLAGTDGAPEATLTARLRALASRLDPDDEWRNQLRRLLPSVAAERAAVLRLAGEADLAALPALSVVLLGEALWQAGEGNAAVSIYRRGQERYPDDFGICFRLAVGLESLPPPRDREAATFYRLALALRPGMREVRHRLGMALHRQGDDAAAERLFGELSRGEPRNAHWLAHLGDALKAQGKLDQAIATYRRCLELEPAHPMVNVTLGSALYSARRSEEAAASLRRALELNPNNHEAHNQLGLVQAEQGDVDAAVASYQRAIELNPKLTKAHSNLGLLLAGEGKLEAAIQSYNRAIELEPWFGSAHSNLGMVFYRQGKLDQAIACHRRAIEVEPRLARAHTNLGTALLRQGKVEEAIASQRRAMELDPRDAFPHYGLGRALQEAGRPEDAIKSYERALELGLRTADVHGLLGNALLDVGRTDEAIASIQRAIELAPTHAHAHSNLGEALRRARRLDEAVEILQRAVELDPKLLIAHINLGIALREQGNHEAATASLRLALELDPDSAHAHSALGDVLAKRGQLEAAIASYRRSLELEPGQSITRTNLGAALVRTGKPEEAVECFRRDLELHPTLPSAYCHLAWLRATAADDRLRDPDEAVRLARRAVELVPADSAALRCLGASLYRQGELAASAEALQRSRTANDRDAATGLFLAMAQHRLGQVELARSSFDVATRATQENDAAEELTRLRAEAAQVLGIEVSTK